MLPTRVLSERELEELAFGRNALKILFALNALLILVLFLSHAAPLRQLQPLPVWIFAVEGFFFVVFFLPVFLFRLARRKESPKLAASRAAYWFVEALGLAT